MTHLKLHCLDRQPANNRLNDTTLPYTFERSRNFNNNGSQRLQSTRAAEDARGDARGDVVANDQFHQRLDRHNRPFGQRVSTVSTTMGKRNIITPAPNRPAESKIPERQHREYPSIYYYGSSPPYSTRRGHRRSQQDELRRDSPSALSPRQQGNVQWRVKQPMTDMTGAAPQNSLESARPAVGRNLKIHDFPRSHQKSKLWTIFNRLPTGIQVVQTPRRALLANRGFL